MIRYNPKPPGGDGIISTMVRLWWMFINNYHTYRWLLAQTVASRRFFLPRNEKRKGETAVITGGSRGIGYAVVKRLLQCDMHVIIGCRDRMATNEAVKALRRKGITTGTVEAIHLDLSSINSIKEFAFKVMKKDVTITVLINNAGVKESPYGITVSGLEQHFQVNYLGHVLVTYMLLPKLHWAAQPDKCGRVVNVSSLEHFGAYPDLNDSQMIEFYSSQKAYMDTKLMLTAWSDFLDRKLQKIGAFVHSYAVHPGFTKTGMWDRVGWVEKIGVLHRLFFEKRLTAAESIAFAALSPQWEGRGGIFLSNNEPIEPHPLCKDEKFQNKLWAISCKMLNIDENNALAPLDELDFGDDAQEELANSEQDEIGDIDHKNQNEIDLDFLHEDEFHACGTFKNYDDEFPPYKNHPHSSKRRGSGDGGVSSNCNLIDTPKSTSSKSRFSFLTSWKHSVRVKLNLKVLKYFSLSPLEGVSAFDKNPNRNSKPYYEYFINSLFSHWNLDKSCLRYLEVVSIFLLRRLDRINSQFKLVQTFVRSE